MLVGTDPTFEPPTDQAGVFSYYVVISFPGNGGCSDITSNTVDITVVAPIETTNTPSVQDICVGGESEELIVTNTTGAGNVTYEWFSNTVNTNTGGTPISGANSDTYTPPGPFDTVGIFYYYVVISDDAAGCFDIPSGVYTINVVADPTVTIDPAGPLEYCQDADADPLTAIPNGGVGDVYTYEWFRVDTPDELVGAGATYTPPTDVVGVFSYYVVITQTASGCSNVSIPVEVTITLGPSITTQPVGDAVCIDGVTPPLTVAYQDGTGTPTYKWFRVDTPDELVGTDPTFEPPTDQAGVFSYYVVISFPGNGGCSDITSNTVDITVVAPIETTNTPSVQDICVGGESEELIVTNTTGAGNVTYEWFSNTVNTNTGGTPISGANSDTYTPPGPFDTVGIFYYYVVISDDAAGCFDIPSGVYTINVQEQTAVVLPLSCNSCGVSNQSLDSPLMVDGVIYATTGQNIFMTQPPCCGTCYIWCGASGFTNPQEATVVSYSCTNGGNPFPDNYITQTILFNTPGVYYVTGRAGNNSIRECTVSIVIE